MAPRADRDDDLDEEMRAKSRDEMTSNEDETQDPEKGATDQPDTTHGEEPTDSNVIDWDGPDDPANPRNWSTKAKVGNTSLIIVLCFLTPLGSSMFAPAVPDVLREFRTHSETLAEFVVSIYILGYAVGPLLIGPASETYGRWIVYAVCNVMFLIFTIACAVAGSFAQLIAFRFFMGAFGVCPITLGGASISDLFPQEKRGASMALFSMGPLLGPVIGPVAGSYLSAAKGWRWNFWVIAIAVRSFDISGRPGPADLSRAVRRLSHRARPVVPRDPCAYPARSQDSHAPARDGQ